MKKFNITGVCIKSKHYMVETDNKIKEIIELINDEEYFTINRARQYGKTTIINQLYQSLKDKYLVIKISFEGLGDKAFSSEKDFCESFVTLVSQRLKQNNVESNIIDAWEENKHSIEKLQDLSYKISELVKSEGKEVILIIDEVDKSSDNQMFLNFIGLFRAKYLDRNEGTDETFKSVILVGVYDIKNLKLKLRNDSEKKYNSPWNIAADFKVDMTFNPEEISTMLVEYEKDAYTGMSIEYMSQLIYDYTSGYPFLVSKLCKLIEEDLNRNWTKEGIEEAVKILLVESNTLFDDLFKNLENHTELYNIIFDVIFNNETIIHSLDNPVINKANMFSIIKNVNGKIAIHNKIFELRIYTYFVSKLQTSERRMRNLPSSSQFVDEKGDLKIEQVLVKFQELMKEEYRNKTEEFMEREGRLLFLAFLKPIINGIGFYFVETQTRDNQRLDLVITFNKKQYIIELKKWYGRAYEEKGYEQLAEYLAVKREEVGYLVMFDFRKVTKEYTKEWIEVKGKRIYEVIV